MNFSRKQRILTAITAAAAFTGLGITVGTSATAASPTITVKSKYFTNGETTLSCGAGKVATGGGVGADNPADTFVARSEPTIGSSGVPTGWKGTLVTTDGASGTGTIYVVCAKTGNAVRID